MSPRDRVFALEHFGIKLGLAHITDILDALDRPDRSWRAVHVAGTNGKGSVTAMVERGLRAAGHRTGRYTSPHLSQIEERIAIDGRSIDAASFDAAAADVMAVVDRLRATGVLETWPTFFEVTTAMAFEIFRRCRVEVAVVEVGLGGRYDATNVLAPDVTAITSIALDHERHLGTTLAEIAFEKAGIIKPSVPVVVGEMVDPAREVIVAHAQRRHAPIVPAGLEHVQESCLAAGRAVLDLQTPVADYHDVTLGLSGAHQIPNAVVAVRTLETCRDCGIHTIAGDVVAGLSEVEWPARLEWLRTSSAQYVLIDAAHNPAGAEALAAYLRDAQIAPTPIVVAIMRDKNAEAIVRALAPVASLIVTTEVASPRCTSATDLATLISRVSPESRVLALADPDSAIAAAFAEGNRTAVAGSIFLAGPVRARLLARGATPIRFPA